MDAGGTVSRPFLLLSLTIQSIRGLLGGIVYMRVSNEGLHTPRVPRGARREE